MNFIYEAVKTAPLDDVVALYESAGWWQESPEARKVIPGMILGSFCFMVVRTGEGKIIGMGRAISDGCSDAYIQDVAVLKDYRGMGIGRELILKLTKVCEEQGIGWIGLVAEPGTREFYEKIGYGPLEGYQPMLYGRKR